MNSLDGRGLASEVNRREDRLSATRWVLSGIVQGVGFRPFVYRLANKHGLKGWVKNCAGQVEIVANGTPDDLRRFERDLIRCAPAIARPEISRVDSLHGLSLQGFQILASQRHDDSDIHVPVDYFVCKDCLRELNDPQDRRYRYPFINCTQCGPRYTLINTLPYDRPNTSMAAFELCPACRKEYTDVLNRRFHAEPVACPACGPKLYFRGTEREVADTQDALAACVGALREGQLVAVKGVGGYHLMCDAANQASVQRLRDRKPRPHKPLAVMFPDEPGLVRLREVVLLSAEEEALLAGPGRPIVLATRKPGSGIADCIAPGLNEIGVMLPYSPLHHLLLNDFGGGLVATSANISGEPVLTDSGSVEQRLDGVAEAFLHHNRPVVRPADDPVYRTVRGRLRPLRLGRGNAPLELELPFELQQPLLAVGGHMKNTLCLAWGGRSVVSSHIGDMGSARSLQVFEQVAGDLQRLFGVQARTLVCDAHPAYATSRWARQQGLPFVAVQHHAAHASALIGEGGGDLQADYLVFTWDGVGYGADQTLWGGEALYGRPGTWRRVASMRPLRLPGAEKAGREPWRSALSVAWELGADDVAKTLVGSLDSGLDASSSHALLRQAWDRKLNTPQSSAVGRLFDAAAALSGLCLQASFEGQGPMWLEALADESAEAVSLPLRQRADGLWYSDWAPLFEQLMAQNCSPREYAALFHASMAEALVQQAIKIRETNPVHAVGLCGGVFQNRRLTEACADRLERNGFAVRLGERLPVNDAGLSFGQVVEFAFST